MVTGLLFLVLQIPEWIEGLKHPKTRMESVRNLADAKPEEAVPLIVRALESDPGFARGTNPRMDAYQAVSEMRTVLGEGMDRRRVIQCGAQVQLLERGTQESFSGIRGVCSGSIGAWSREWQELALQVLTQTLLDVDPVVRRESCKSVSLLGTAAESLMPALELLLVGVGKDGKPLSWYRADGLFPLESNYEFQQREEAALARMHVRGMDVDRGLLDRLDERGQDALCSAWAQFGLGVILEHRRTSEESPALLLLKEHLDLLINPLERSYLFVGKEYSSDEAVVFALYQANEIGLLNAGHREVICARAAALLARNDLASNPREGLQHLKDEFAK
jgi:hypothetical protein